MTHRNLPRTARSAVLLALLPSLLVGCGHRKAAGLEVVAVHRATVAETVDAAGSVEARATATLTAPADATIQSLFVADGQRVQAGQLLAQLAAPAALARLEAARSAAARVPSLGVPAVGVDASAADRAAAAAASALEQARSTISALPPGAAREQALATLAQTQAAIAATSAQLAGALQAFQAGLGSLGSALTALGALQSAQAETGVTAAQAAVDALVLRAPVAGVVQLGGPTPQVSAGGAAAGALASLPSSVQGLASGLLGGGASSSGGITGAVAAGSRVSSGSTVLTVVDTSQLRLTADVDETDVLLVRPGQHARVELDAVPGSSYPATVLAVALTPTASARGGVSYTVTLSLSAGRTPDGRLAPAPRPGMSAVASLAVRTSKDAIAVPTAAVVRVGNLDAVWVDDHGRARQQVVVLGAQGDASAAVTSGLSSGDRVVARGADGVRAGQKLPA